MPITPSLRHCSNKYKLAREGEKDGEKDKERDEDIEKGEEFSFFIIIIIIIFFLGQFRSRGC